MVLRGEGGPGKSCFLGVNGSSSSFRSMSSRNSLCVSSDAFFLLLFIGFFWSADMEQKWKTDLEEEGGGSCYLK